MSMRRICTHSSWTRRFAAGAAALSAAALPSAAQPAGGAAPPASGVTFKISDVSAAQQLVKVPVGKSVVIDFSQPVREARLAKADVAEVAAISPTQILVTGRQFGTTQLIVWVSEKEQRVFDVAVELELDRLAASIKQAVPRAKVRVYSLMDAVVLSGTAPDAEAAQRIQELAAAFSSRVMNQLRVAGVQQVMVRCTVAELDRRMTRELGFNGWLGGENFTDFLGLNQLDNINPINIGVPAGASFSGGAVVPFVAGDNGIPVSARTTLSFALPSLQMQVFVHALQENGLLRVLAEPSLVTVNGQEANFLAGGEYPVPIPNQNGIGIEYRQFGVRLKFTPAILTENTIRLKVAPEVSEPDPATGVTVLGTTVPGLSQRKAETVVELGSGQTFVMAGLLSERARASSRAVPGLGEVPVLGALFRSIAYQSDRSELVILVTPELVEPVSSDQITYVPGALHVAPNDLELYLLGALDGKTEKPLPPQLQPRVNGSWPVKPADLYGPSAGMKLRGPVGPAGGDEGK